MNQPLQPLSAFLAAQTDLNWLPSQEPAVTVARGTHVRWRIQREVSDAEPGLAYGRRESLMAQDINPSDADSREFAQGIANALTDHLTLRDLRHLARVFAEAVAQREQERAAAAVM